MSGAGVGVVVIVDEVGAVAAAALLEFGRGAGQHARTATTVDAGPGAQQERHVEHPGAVFVGIVEREVLVEVVEGVVSVAHQCIALPGSGSRRVPRGVGPTVVLLGSDPFERTTVEDRFDAVPVDVGGELDVVGRGHVSARRCSGIRARRARGWRRWWCSGTGRARPARSGPHGRSLRHHAVGSYQDRCRLSSSDRHRRRATALMVWIATPRARHVASRRSTSTR